MRRSLVALLCAGLALAVVPAFSDDAQVVTGIVADLDAVRLKLTVRTDLDKNVYVEVAKPDLLREVQTGDRVTLRLNHEGKAEKVMRLTVPELPPPADSPQPPARP